MSSLTFFWQGYRATTPLLIGVAPFGLVFGALAVAAGATPMEAIGMSLLVLAGSSQFIAAELLRDGASALVIVLTTFLVNLRHFLYSTSLAVAFRPLSNGWKWLLAYAMVDEVYATVSAIRHQRNFAPRELGWFFVGASANLVSIWWLTTAIGALVGDIVPPQITEILGFTLPLVLTSLVVPLLVTRSALLAALSAALAGIILAPIPHNLGLLAASGLGILIGVIMENSRTPETEQTNI